MVITGILVTIVTTRTSQTKSTYRKANNRLRLGKTLRKSIIFFCANQDFVIPLLGMYRFVLTLKLLMSYIYGAPSKARNANVVYIWTYVWQR